MTTTTSNPFQLNITAGSGGAWVPPYASVLPTAPGQIATIGGTTASPDSLSQYPTNVWSHVAPTPHPNQHSMLQSGDSTSVFIESYSPGGAVVIAGSGGHNGFPNFGACLFDFTDAAWKRVWTRTTPGGVDVSTVNAANNYRPPAAQLDGNLTRIHGCKPYVSGTAGGTDLIEQCSGWDAGAPMCFNFEHWKESSLQPTELQPLKTNPWEQTWEFTREEWYPWSETLVENANGDTISGPHGWKHPGQWAAMHGNLYGDMSFYVAPCNRWQPTPVGTLEPTQSGLPAPSHTWDNSFEMTPAQGGGPKGSYVVGYHGYIGSKGNGNLHWSHRFDLDTGIWHKYSVNSQRGGTSAVAGVDPWYLPGATASCVDVVPSLGIDRVYMIALLAFKGGEINYLNRGDRRWRHLKLTGAQDATINTQSVTADPVRRVLIINGTVAPYLYLIDLSKVGPEPNPTSTNGPFVPTTMVGAGSVTSLSASRIMPWRYFPPNGKYYRLVPAKYGVDNGANPLPRITHWQRLTPPPIIANPPANYYLTQPWTIDEIPMVDANGNPATMPNGHEAHVFSTVQHKWFFYVPALQLMAWLPLETKQGSTYYHRCVYLFKPY